ncbi:2TM domain-containing protein [Candidatus Bipolaricaulota bacterium]
MTTRMSEEEILQLARRRAGAKKGFMIHFGVYLAVNVALVLVWAFAAGGGFPWFIFPIGGWGIGVLFHYLGAYGTEKRAGGPNDAAVEREAEKIRREQS